MNSRLSLVVVLTSFLAVGCTPMAQQAAPSRTEPLPGSVEGRLEKTTSQVERMLAEMNALERSRQDNPGQWKTAADVLPPDHPMMRRITAIWSGDVRLVIRKMADQFGMDVIVKGKSPTPIMVTVSVRDQPFVAVLESIGAQTGNVASITCDVAANLLQIEYR